MAQMGSDDIAGIGDSGETEPLVPPPKSSTLMTNNTNDTKNNSKQQQQLQGRKNKRGRHNKTNNFQNMRLAIVPSIILSIITGGVLYWKLVPKQVDLDNVSKHSLKTLNQHLVNIPKLFTDNDHCEATVILMRHCDDHGIHAKDDRETGDKHCSFVGFERSKYLTTLFGNNNNENNDQETEQQQQPSSSSSYKWRTPKHLFAMLPKQRSGINYRQIETLLPLAEKYLLSINIVQEPIDVSERIFEWLQETPDEMCGTVTVVAWKHAHLSEIAANLGCDAKRGCKVSYDDEEFDELWQIKFVFNPPAPTELSKRLEEETPNAKALLIDDHHLLPVNIWDSSSSTTSKEEKEKKEVGWAVYGSVTHENFDPLHYAMENGFYDP